jgi:hypothetical protein
MKQLDGTQWLIDGTPQDDLDPRALGDAIFKGADEIRVPESYSPILTALAETPEVEMVLTAEKLMDLAPELERIRKRVVRPESKPEDKLYIETTLGDAEAFLGPADDLREASIDGANGALLQAVAEAVKAHREGWRELPPTIVRAQISEVTSPSEERFMVSVRVDDAYPIIGFLQEVTRRKAFPRPVGELLEDLEELRKGTAAGLASAIAERRSDEEFMERLQRSVEENAEVLDRLAGPRFPFPIGARVRIKRTGEGPFTVMRSRKVDRAAEEPRERYYTLMLNGHIIGHYPESELVWAEPPMTGQTAAGMMRAIAERFGVSIGSGPASTMHYGGAACDLKPGQPTDSAAGAYFPPRLPESDKGISATDAMALWRHFAVAADPDARRAALKFAVSGIEDVMRDLIPYLRHAPGCIDHQDREQYPCLCGLEATLTELGQAFDIEVVRCHGCGVHAITPDGTEDWAWREEEVEVEEGTHLIPPRKITPYCHGCAVASMDAWRERPPFWRRVLRQL